MSDKEKLANMIYDWQKENEKDRMVLCFMAEATGDDEMNSVAICGTTNNLALCNLVYQFMREREEFAAFIIEAAGTFLKTQGEKENQSN